MVGFPPDQGCEKVAKASFQDVSIMISKQSSISRGIIENPPVGSGLSLGSWKETAMNPTNVTLEAARAYLKAGLSLLPVARDGSKSPDFGRLPRVPDEDGRYRPTWDPFKNELPPSERVESWFQGSEPAGIGIICGDVSGGLETLDFDTGAETHFSGLVRLGGSRGPWPDRPGCPSPRPPSPVSTFAIGAAI